MRSFSLLAAAFVLFFSAGLSRAADKPLTLRWHGQSCFLLTSPGGAAILMDPFHKEAGYPVPALKVDAVTVSHEHFDHNNVEAAKPGAKIIPGLTESGFLQVNEQVGDVHIRSVATYHDSRQGMMRGKNTVFIFETAGLTVVHLGDLGHVLDEEQVKAIGKTDVLLIPVGGTYTIDAAEATRVMGQLKPKMVIPMHYKTDKTVNLPLAPVDNFLQGKPRVERKKGNQLEISQLPAETTIIVLDYKP
jgi:L-ascorbate metabolism protein UlaG (beta-lactamase superfamily)